MHYIICYVGIEKTGRTYNNSHLSLSGRILGLFCGFLFVTFFDKINMLKPSFGNLGFRKILYVILIIILILKVKVSV